LPWVHSTIRVTRDRWRNWSGELASQPRRLYCDDAGGPWKSPRTLEDLQAIVRDARAEGASIRVFGSSHSWSALVPNDSGYVVDNRMINSTDGQYNVSISPASADGRRKARATVPPGLLSSEFEHWLWKVGYSMPASAFEDCFTVGGMAATATHGAGIDIGTVSDMVVGMTFVDGRGEVRRWDRETCSEDELAAIQCGLGCLGLIHSITFEVEPRYETYHEAMVIRYADYFADTDEARANLRELHETHTSVEFFWWPFRYSGLPVVSRPEINPEVFVLATDRRIPSDARPRGALRRFWYLEVVDLACMIGAGTAMRTIGNFPRLTFLLAWCTSFTNIWVTARCGAFRMPQYDANHFVNATGVEFTTAMASEWSIPFRRDAPLDAADGYERLRQSFALLHDLVVDAFESHPIHDPNASPVVIAVEMRTLAASTALLSPGYQPDDQRPKLHYAAPELVTTAGHPAWEAFARRANIIMTTSSELLGDQVRCHQGKPCQAWPHPDYPVDGMRGYLREQYRAAGTWDRFLAVRAAVDPDGVFLNDYLRAWFGLSQAGINATDSDQSWAAE
jgi:FAD/FMN-containing dehydrogenase